MPAQRPFLVLTRAGRRSLHTCYARDDDRRTFDVIALEYEAGAPIAEDARRISLPGSKLAGYADFFRSEPDCLNRYSAVALMDDDIETNVDAINRCFSEGLSLNLHVWQPSLSWDSYLTYAVFLNCAGFRVRYTNFIEMMCPFFSADALRRALPLFGMGYETGIDLAWCKLSPDPRLCSAIIDTVVVKHTRPVGSTKAQQGFDLERGYDSQIEQFLGETGLRFFGAVVYAAQTVQKQFVKGRVPIALRMLPLLGAVFRSPLPPLNCLRIVTDTIRHTLSRPVNIEPFDLPQFLKRRNQVAS